MAAERAPQLQQEAEVIYLLVPPAAAPTLPKPTAIELIQDRIWHWTNSRWYTETALVLHSLMGAVIFTIMAMVGLYVLYMFKSYAGIDLFPGLHLEDFVPVPGYGRW